MPKLPQEGPNPLFTRWLEEWRDQAEENGRLKSQRAYERALSSLRKYPLPLRSGREARILMYFGEKICRQLDEQLERHRSSQDDTAPAGGPIPMSPCKGHEDIDDPTYSDRLVLPPALSSLEPVQPQEQPSKVRKSSCERPNLGLSKPQFVLRPGGFDVILCVDFIETTGGPTSRKQELVRELQGHNVPFSIRKLHVGDFLWVARERGPHGAELLPPTTARELVLDYVVERKRMPDLCSSIIDGRFREQKFRLRQCGLSHPIYLVEDANSAQHLSLPEKTLQQAIINTQVIDGFFVKRTRDIRESAAYLTIMTRHLTRQYRDKMLLSCTKQELEDERPLQPRAGICRLLTFAEFNEGAVKNKAQTVYEVFARQLMQVSGLSGEKAAAILEKYKTPASLMEAYAACPDGESQEYLLSTIKCGQLQRNLGPSLSKMLAQLYCTPGPLP
ncbi:crossover junction endonuclease MUS81 [Notechis scutatus]|uniref:Crossover junction endonuclease MUS81 n=1 Tax=Notechis scutatus TaxID=8663 RepID=A0A6J1VRU7_9SAUR|nr:crossover junction endonuclease MUS81 [Notechis scutatus]